MKRIIGFFSLAVTLLFAVASDVTTYSTALSSLIPLLDILRIICKSTWQQKCTTGRVASMVVDLSQMPNINKKISKKKSYFYSMLLFKVLWHVKTNPKCHVLIQRDSKCTRWGLPSSASFHDKEPVPHITNGFCWTGLGGNTGSMSAECSPKSSWLLVCQGLSDSSISDQLLRWYHGGSDVHAA